MLILGYKYFNFAGQNDFVVFSRNGVEKKAGKGLAGLIGPGTSVSIVPLGVQTVSFQVTEYSQDKQQVLVQGELVVDYVPEMRENFDFSVFPVNGNYRNDPTAQIEDQVRIAVRGPIRTLLAEAEVASLTATGAVQIEETLAEAVADASSDLMQRLAKNNIAVQSASVKVVMPAERGLAGAIGASEREALLAQQDDAVADRRMNAAESDRDIRTFEEQTALSLVEEQAKRVAKEGENLIAQAGSEAEANEKRLAIYKDMPSGDVLALAILKAAEEGVGNLSIDPSLLAAVRNTVAGDQ